MKETIRMSAKEAPKKGDTFNGKEVLAVRWAPWKNGASQTYIILKNIPDKKSNVKCEDHE